MYCNTIENKTQKENGKKEKGKGDFIISRWCENAKSFPHPIFLGTVTSNRSDSLLTETKILFLWQ